MHLLSNIIWVLKPTITLAILLFKDYNNEDVECAEAVINQIESKTLTLVNFKEDIRLTKTLHTSMNFKIIVRNFLRIEMDTPNEAYIVWCENFNDCCDGVEDLMKDRYWNPNSTFCFILRRNKPQNLEKLFKKLHNVYVFKIVVIHNENIYFYAFNEENHCIFTPQAIFKQRCEKLSDYNNTIIINTFLTNTKVPYSACNLKIRINIFEPYIFPPANQNDMPVGFEEEFVKVIKSDFTNATFEYNINNSFIGHVSGNFTTSHALKDINNGLIDGIIGAAILSPNRLSAFDITHPHITDDMILIVPKANKIEKWVVLFTVFKTLVWTLVILTFIIMTILAFALKIYGRWTFHVFMATVTYMFGHFTNNTNRRNGGYFMLMWVLFSWFIACFYQSDLSSGFTKPSYYKQVNSLEDVIKKKYKLHLSVNADVYFKNTKGLDISDLPKPDRICKDDIECLNIVADGGKKFALNSRLLFEYYEPKYYKNNGEPKLHAIKYPYYHVLVTSYFRKGNPNIKRIRDLERHVITSSVYRKSMLSLIHMNKLRFYKLRREQQSKSLKCKDIAGLYYVFLCGCSLAVITFLCELRMKRRNIITCVVFQRKC